MARPKRLFPSLVNPDPSGGARRKKNHGPRQLFAENRVVGPTPYERNLLRGQVYVLKGSDKDLGTEIVGVFTEPASAIALTGTHPASWHHLHEHYWDESGVWTLDPFVLDEPAEWFDVVEG